MATTTAPRNVYDPRVRELIRATGNPDLFPELSIPRSTVAGWLRGDFKPAVGTEAVSKTEAELHARLAKLERRIQILVAVITDSGVGNVNSTVDEALGDGPLQRVLAQIDIVESNSLLEAWWRS